MQKLLYHPKHSENEESVFDKAISEICTNNAIKLVSPYIGIDYLQRITALSVNWKLISDVNEWLSSSSSNDRMKIVDFIKLNLEKIHHYNDIHAKVVISQDKAYLGSANLTSSGLLRRTEMGILIDDKILLQELDAWFDENWLDTAPPNLWEIADFLKSNNEDFLERRIPKKTIKSKGKTIQKTFVKIKTPTQNKIETSAPIIEQSIPVPVPVPVPRINSDIESLINHCLSKISKNSFSFSDFCEITEVKNSEFNRNDLEKEFLYFVANDYRTVFSKKKINKVVFLDEKFSLATQSNLTKSIENYDRYLLSLIRRFSFYDFQEFKRNHKAIEQLKTPTNSEDFMIQSLLDSELIMKDELEKNSFMLNENFDWVGSFKIFQRSYQAWLKKLPPKVVSPKIQVIRLQKNKEEILKIAQPQEVTEIKKPIIYSYQAAKEFGRQIVEVLKWNRLFRNNSRCGYRQLGGGVFVYTFDGNFDVNSIKYKDIESTDGLINFNFQYSSMLDQVQDHFYYLLSNIINNGNGEYRANNEGEIVAKINRAISPCDDNLLFFGGVFFGLIPGLKKLFKTEFVKNNKNIGYCKISFKTECINSDFAKKLPRTYLFISNCIDSKSGYFYKSIGDIWIRVFPGKSLYKNISPYFSG